MRWRAASSRSLGCPGGRCPGRPGPGPGSAAATLMPASGPPLLSWSSTRVSAVVEMVSSAVSSAAASVTASTVSTARPGRPPHALARPGRWRRASSRRSARCRSGCEPGLPRRAPPELEAGSSAGARPAMAEVVGDDHERAAVVGRQRLEQRRPPGRCCRRRGCRWARRPAPAGVGWPGPGRWRPAGARRRSAPPGRAGPGRPGRPRRAARRPAPGGPIGPTPASEQASSTFSAAVSASSRPKCWNTKPTVSRRKAASCDRDRPARSAPSTTTGPSGAARGRRAPRAASTCPRPTPRPAPRGRPRRPAGRARRAPSRSRPGT